MLVFLPIILCSKKKKGNKRKKERVSRQKILKGCHQDQNVTVLALLERLEFKNFSCQPTMVVFSMFHDFEIHFAGPAWIPNYGQIYLKNAFHDKMTFLDY